MELVVTYAQAMVGLGIIALIMVTGLCGTVWATRMIDRHEAIKVRVKRLQRD